MPSITTPAPGPAPGLDLHITGDGLDIARLLSDPAHVAALVALLAGSPLNVMRIPGLARSATAAAPILTVRLRAPGPRSII